MGSADHAGLRALLPCNFDILDSCANLEAREAILKDAIVVEVDLSTIEGHEKPIAWRHGRLAVPRDA